MAEDKADNQRNPYDSTDWGENYFPQASVKEIPKATVKFPAFAAIMNWHTLEHLPASFPFLHIIVDETQHSFDEIFSKRLDSEKFDGFVEQIASGYIAGDQTVREHFSTGLKMILEKNDIYAKTMRNLQKSLTGQETTQEHLLLANFLQLIGSPSLQLILGNAIVRAQLAAQYNNLFKDSEWKRLEKQGIQFSQDIGEDPLAVALVKNLFKEDIVVISSTGSPQTGKIIRTEKSNSTQEIEEELIGDEQFLAEITESLGKPHKGGKAIPVRGNKKVPHQEGSWLLFKKMRHAQESKGRFKTNFPIEAELEKTLGITPQQLESGRISQLTLEQGQAVQLRLQQMSLDYIREIAGNAQTVILRKRGATLLNYLGQGISVAVDYDRNLDRITSIRGFVDSMSVARGPKND